MANKDKLLETAQKFLAKGQLPKAIGEYQKLVEAFPKDFRNRQKLAELLSREKRSDEAQPHYEAVAKNFAETGFYLKAIAIYKQMQKIEPGRVDIYLRLAELNEKQGLIGNALNEYRSLIAFYEKNRMRRETIGVLQKMIALDPENHGFRAKLIETLVAVGEEADALEQLRALVRFLAGKGEHAKIVKLYEKFLELCPEDVESRLPLAESLLACGQAEKALVLLKALLKQNPENPALLTVLTDCHVALGSHADARLTCQHLLKEHPQDLDLREKYVRICLTGEDHERALEFLEESKELFSQGNRVGVLRELYETLQTSLPDNARLQATLAAIYEAVGEGGTPSAFSPAGTAGIGEEETADSAIVDAAIGDVEQLDLVGEAVVPSAGVPPLGAPAPPVPATKAKGGLELELDLDLDLELPAVVPTPTAPPAVVPSEPPSAAVAASPEDAAPPSFAPAPALEMELELDLGGLDELELEPPPVEPALAAVQPEPLPEPEVELPPVAVPEAVVEEPAAPVASGDEHLPLPDLGDLEFEIEPSFATPLGADELMPEPPPAEAPTAEMPDLEDLLSIAQEEVAGVVAAETELAGPAEVEPPTLFTEADIAGTGDEVEGVEPGEVAETAEVFGETDVAEVFEENEAAGIFEEVEAAEAGEEAAFIGFGEEPQEEESQELEATEGVEEIEEVEDLDGLEELEELDEVEELEEVEEYSEVEELEEVEDLEELEALDECEEVADEAEITPIEPVATSRQRLRDSIEEAEFYLRQGLVDDAERLAQGIREQHGELPELTAMLGEIEVQRRAAAESKPKDAIFDLMADIKDSELLGATDFLGDGSGDGADEFSLEVSTEDAEDAQSHFDLGIAYKEMGLLDDAITEFGKAFRDPSRQLDCLTLKGQCLAELGHFDKAESTYKEGLTLASLSEEGMIALRYELGLLYETLGRPVEALESYQVVADHDLFYRDVTDKLKDLRQKLGIDDQAIEAVSEGGSGRDRISFV